MTEGWPSGDHARRRTQGRVRLASPTAEATLQKLLRGGREAMRSAGFHGASINDIVRASGVSRATFYLYFDEKIDFLRAMVVDCLAETRRRAISPPPYRAGREGLAAVREWIDVISEVYDEYAAVWSALVAERASDPVLLLLDQSRTVEATEQLTAVLRDAPGAERVEPEMLALALVVLIERMFATVPPADRALVNRRRDTVAEFVFTAIYGGRVPDPDARRSRDLSRATR